MRFNIMVDEKRLDETYVTGRNGTFLCRGIEVLTYDKMAYVTPIGKRGVLNAGWAIPVESMDEICEKWLALRKMRKMQKKSKKVFDNSGAT